jgi:hypothetical protein
MLPSEPRTTLEREKELVFTNENNLEDDSRKNHRTWPPLNDSSSCGIITIQEDDNSEESANPSS